MRPPVHLLVAGYLQFDPPDTPVEAEVGESSPAQPVQTVEELSAYLPLTNGPAPRIDESAWHARQVIAPD